MNLRSTPTGSAGRAVAVGFSGALVLGAIPAVASPQAPASTAVASASDQLVRNCEQTVDGERLRLQLRITFTSATSNDIDSIRVRATDNRERRAFRNTDVNLNRVRVKVVNTSGVTKVNRASNISPFVLDLNPKRAGRNALSISARASWIVRGHQTIPLTCFVIDE